MRAGRAPRSNHGSTAPPVLPPLPPSPSPPLQLRHTNKDRLGLGHNVDMHCVSGPGGGAPATYAEPEQTRTGIFKLQYPGLFIYHWCVLRPPLL